MKKSLVFILALTVAFSSTARSLEKMMNECISDYGAISVAVAVVKHNKLVYVGEFGKKSYFNGQHTDVVRIASISKTFVGTAVMTLVDAGKIDLDAPAAKYLPFELKNNPKYPSTTITVRMLMNHTSSISHSSYGSLDVINPAVNDSWTDCYKDWEPGTKYKYSNLGFNILAAIVEYASGERFDKYVRAHICEPLGLNASFNVEDLDASLCVPVFAWSKKDECFVPQSDKAYAKNPALAGNYRLGYDAAGFSGAGGMKISAKDLARYMMMHMNYGELDGVRILSENSSRAMQTYNTPTSPKRETFYGLAMRQKPDWCGGKTIGGHLGSAYGVKSTMDFNVEEGWGFVTLCNGDASSIGNSDISKALDNVLYEYFIAKDKNR